MDHFRPVLRNITLRGKDSGSIVTLCGSAYKNVGVQPLMDAVVNLLPSPDDLDFSSFLRFYPKGNFCGLAFKTAHHPATRAQLTFVRVYSGELSEGDSVFNVGRSCSEKVAKIMIANADEFRPVKSVSAGAIAVVTGLRQTITGDTITQSASVAKKVSAH